MPATTAKYKLPYPLGSDRVMDGDDQIRKLAQSVENMVQTGVVTIPVTALNTNTDAAVVVPVAFAGAPVVSLTMYSSFPQNYVVSLFNGTPPTAAGFTVRGRQIAGGAAQPLDVHWIAVGPVSAVVAAAETEEVEA